MAFEEEKSEVWIDRCPTLPVRTDGMKWCGWLCVAEHAKQSDVLLCIIYFVLTTDQATNKTKSDKKLILVAMVFYSFIT